MGKSPERSTEEFRKDLSDHLDLRFDDICWNGGDLGLFFLGLPPAAFLIRFFYRIIKFLFKKIH